MENAKATADFTIQFGIQSPGGFLRKNQSTILFVFTQEVFGNTNNSLPTSIPTGWETCRKMPADPVGAEEACDLMRFDAFDLTCGFSETPQAHHVEG